MVWEVEGHSFKDFTQHQLDIPKIGDEIMYNGVRRYSIRYGDEHKLQTLDTCVSFPLVAKKDEAIWIIFIHGGAWRDPHQNSRELDIALLQLRNQSIMKRIAGFASINYGLSTNEGDDKSLNVKHPQHIRDVIKALEWLKKEYGIGTDENGNKGWDWIAMGHSCGATLAMQACMSYSQPWGNDALGAWTGKPPLAVVGLEGIYDLPLLNQNHIDQPFYKDFLTAAFGSDEKVWKQVSPVHGNYKPAYTKGGMRLVLLAHSDEDELVEWEQTHAMKKGLVEQGWKFADSTAGGANVTTKEPKHEQEVKLLKLSGLHDDIWKKGDGLLIAIETVVRHFFP